MDLNTLMKQSLAGWNTWYTENILSHVLLPWGFSINLSFRKKSNGDIMRNVLINRDPSVRVDIRSWDGAYTCLHLRHGNIPIKVESVASDGEQFILVTPEGYYSADEQMIVETAFLWGKDGILTKQNGQLGAVCPDGREIKLYANTAPQKVHLPVMQSPHLFFALNSPVVISTVPCDTLRACALMQQARLTITAQSERYGAQAASYQAMQSCLGWNTVYDPCKNIICTPVTRNWMRNGYTALYCWDTLLAGMMFSLDDVPVGYLNVKEMLDAADVQGMVPNATSAKGNSQHSQPPVGSMVVENMFKNSGNIEFVKYVYPKLLAWNTWYYEHRMTEEGYMCWGSKNMVTGVGELFDAKCESGMDNSPIFDDAVYNEENGLCMMADVGLAGLFIKDCYALIELSRIAGTAEDAAMLEERISRAEHGLSMLWNGEDGIFENRDIVTGKLQQRLTPMNFFALYSHKISLQQKKLMVEKYLLNPEEFWGDYVLPSISRSDPAFSEQQYWRGRIWAPLNMLVYEALKEASLYDEARQLAEQSEKLFMIEWEKTRHVYENYSAVDGLGSSARQSDAFYHWGALLGYMAIDAQGLPHDTQER